MTGYAEVPDEIVERLRVVCGALPEVVEERAWRGTRWRVGQRAFAHVLEVEAGRPPSYAEASGKSDGSVLTFRAAGPELAALSNAPHPFFSPRWAANVVGLVLDDDTDWEEVEELLVESYLVAAPKRLKVGDRFDGVRVNFRDECG
ncbi:putative DNA-binding protein (MmcQ/YjbR family) [Lentzea atacamensis]|uniref:Putative DNA-binding protein (MmcQ/YjbR family) n=1 Tax=Lentzea atacamensis TaxID=531938 RepID=A0A316I742_9PSEU|nr:MmcQ/YjbR family DNA-binding protein [Lentzea atacamensis]PWK89071.1 putative DNA-binding protein (MmcQ/YjbR family) [Lentzea atacamensis]